MPKSKKQKSKLLYVAKMLLEQTDDEHGLTMRQIMSNLQEVGIEAEHKSIYNDINTLRSFGMDIVKRGGARATEYAIGERDFRFEELIMIAAAVESSRLLTSKMCKEIVGKLKTLTSRHQAEQLTGFIQASNGVHKTNRNIFYYMMTILSAIENKHQIAFRYYRHTLAGRDERPSRDGSTTTTTPVCVLYSDGNGYLATYNSASEEFYMYRIDHMRNVRETAKPAEENDIVRNFNPPEFAMRSFGMFSGESTRVTLLVKGNMINAIYDRFGEKVDLINVSDSWAQGEWARAIVDVIPSPPFYGWIAVFGGDIYIEGPSDVVADYKAHIKRALVGNMPAE